MDNGKNRVTITIPMEQKEELEKLKEEKFAEKSNSEMFRCLLKEGLLLSAREKQEIESGSFR